MDDTPELIDQVLCLLRRERTHGRRWLRVPPETLAEPGRARAPETENSSAGNRSTRKASEPSPEPVAAARKHAEAVNQMPRAPATPAPNGSATDAAEVPKPQWDELQRQAEACRNCPLHRSRTKVVFGEGASDARLMFIGEGPGQEEDLQGRPFVGEAGKLLDRMIAAMQFERKDVYIANVVKCHPPGNRTPHNDEVNACRTYLERQIELIAPQAIVLLGAVPLRGVLGIEGILRHRGTWREYKGIPVMPTVHPAYLLRSPAAKRDAWNDLQQVMRRLGKDPERTQRRSTTN